MPAGMQTERPGWPRQLHAGLIRRAVPFPVVARMAAGDQIFPRGFTCTGAGDDMVERHFARRQSAVTVLAGVAIAHQNVFARQSTGLVWNAAVLEQPNDGRHAKRPLRRMNLRRR